MNYKNYYIKVYCHQQTNHSSTTFKAAKTSFEITKINFNRKSEQIQVSIFQWKGVKTAEPDN